MFNGFISLWSSARQAALLSLFLFFCAGFADGVVVPFFPLWAHGEAHIPVGLIGLLFGCYAGGELIATPLIGGIADRVGRRPVLIFSSLGVGTGFAALFFVHNTLLTAGILLLTGMAESVLHPTISTVIADVTPGSAHRRWFSLVQVSSSAGQVFGPAIGALLAMASLGTVFLGAGAVLILGGIVMAVFLRETMGAGRDGGADPDNADGDAEEEGLSALLPALRDKRLGMLLVWFTLFEVCGNWIDSVLPLYARQHGILNSSGIGLLFSYSAVLTVCLQMLVSRLAEARSHLLLMSTAGAASVLGFLLLIAVPSLPGLIMAVSLCALAQMLTRPIVPAAISGFAPAAQRTSYMAASSVAVDLKDSLGPAIGTALYALAPRLPWIAGIPLVVAASFGLSTAVSDRLPLLEPQFNKSQQ